MCIPAANSRGWMSKMIYNQEVLSLKIPGKCGFTNQIDHLKDTKVRDYVGRNDYCVKEN